jgi:dsRNA-specific ribonuclease
VDISTFWYWYTYGMGLTDYVTIYTGCLLAGVLVSEASRQYHKFVNKVLPEQITNIEYNEKVEELNRRLDKYRKEHPNEKLTPEIVERIRTDVFFG